ncbi:UDP-glucoronosyl and UDP-glucosyl transferase, partial [Aphelenchoides avenae]
MGKIANILVEGAYEVVLYQPKFNDEYTVSGTKLARVIQRERDFEVSLDFLNLEKDAWRDSMGGMNDNNDKLMETIMKMFTSMRNSCERQLSDHDLMETLKSEKFDVAIGESMDVCFYGIVRRAGIPKYISAFSTNLYVGAASILGLPALPSFIPGFIEVQPNMTYWDRARNLMTNVLLYYTGKQIFVDPIEKVVKAHLGEDFDTEEAIALSSYFFVNSEEHVAYPRPITHKIIDVGGMGMPKAAQLDEKFERILRSSKEGVVLVSFGSLSKSIFMPDAAKKAFVEAFAQFPNVTFLWKYERPEDKIAEGHSNVVLVDWIPQIELLGHPRLLAFITHAGMNSISEAVYKGVPLICIPLL